MANNRVLSPTSEYNVKMLKERPQRIQFLNAVKSCEFEELQKVLRFKAFDVNMRFRSAMTPLMQAAEKENSQCVDLLIKSGADVNLKDFSQYTALWYAVQNGNLNCASLLLDAKADVNATDKFGETALFKAASSGKADCVKLLCSAGADVNIINNAENTALMFAAIYRHAECIKELVSAGADVNTKNSDRQNALIMATSKKNVIRFGKSRRKMRFKKSKADDECIQVLIELGADVNHADHYRRTALYCAVAAKSFDCARLLLKANANIHLCDPNKISISLWFEWWNDRDDSFDSECWEILYAAGREDTTLKIQNFEQKFNSDWLSLRCMCRQLIRQCLAMNNPSCNLFLLVDQLPLPTALKSMLVYYMF